MHRSHFDLLCLILPCGWPFNSPHVQLKLINLLSDEMSIQFWLVYYTNILYKGVLISP
jgi:hypothetical protein